MTASSHAAGRFECSNPPATRWGTYYCVSGSYDDEGNLSEVEYGTCAGSDADGEAEPEETVSMDTLSPDVSLAASSKQWKDAYAYDVTTEEHGKATLYLQPAELQAKGDGLARLKFSKSDVKLPCYFN
jgi:hypothetical protein